MPIPTGIPVIAIVFRFSDRKTGENDAPSAARLRLEGLDIEARQRLADVKPCVEHDHVVVRGTDRRYQSASIGEASRVEEKESIAGGGEG
jgi:hypothetical protein